MKSYFEPPFALDRGIGVDRWSLREPLMYYSELLGRWICVPKLFETDFASVPRFFHRLLPKNGEYDAAAVVHDWLYYAGELHKDAADRIFLEALEALGVSAWRRLAMYQAVCLFGEAAWRKHRARAEVVE